MRTPRHQLVRVVLLALAIAASACSASTPAPASAPTASGPTAGQFAGAGKTVYMTSCAKCHGQNGEGVTAPPNIGPKADLAKYNNAKNLYDFVRGNMPQDAPGTLSQDQYLQVVSYLLVQNKLVAPDAPINPSTLESITLSR